MTDTLSSIPPSCANCPKYQDAGEKARRLAATVFDNTMEGIAVTDASGVILAINPAFTVITGYSEFEALGRNMSLLKSDRHDKGFYEAIWQSLHMHGHWQGEVLNRRKNGEIFPQWTTISTVPGDEGGAASYVSVFTDISSIKDAVSRLEFLAHHDALTGLPNRRLLMSRMEQAMNRAQRAGRFCATIFLDLDRFKEVNDLHGHRGGDELLQQVADRIACRLRKTDTLARLGGDEFVALLEDLPRPEGAAQITRILIDQINQPFRLSSGLEASVGASAGISIFPDHGCDAETLIGCADDALYRAKEAGRNGYRFHTAE